MSKNNRWLDLTLIPGLLLTFFFLSAWLIPLCGDEAYYWLWSTRPQWGYCDHPPAVAWLGHVFEILGAGNVAFFRIPGWLAYLASLLLMGRLAGTALEDAGAPAEESQGAFRWTVAIAVVSPLLAHYATEMGPDTPLLLAWSLGCWSAYQAVRGRRIGWLLFGVASALAIYSKISGWLLPLCLLGYLISSPERRRHLLTLNFWLGVLLGAVLLVPHLAWNYLHDGQNYFFQWHLRRQHMAWQFGNLFKPVELLADQGILSAFTLVALFWAFRRKKTPAQPGDQLVSLLLWFALPLQSFFLVFRILGVGRWNWPLPSYLPLSALLALWVVRQERFRRPAFRIAFWLTAIWSAGSLSMRAFPELQLTTASILEPASQLTVRTNDLALAYPEVGRRMREAVASDGIFLLNDDYTEAAALSYYSGNFVRVVAPYREGSQFLWWNRYEDLLGQDALLVCHRRLEDMPHVLHALQSSFESYKRLPSWEIESPIRITFYPVRCTKLLRPLLQNLNPSPLTR